MCARSLRSYQEACCRSLPVQAVQARKRTVRLYVWDNSPLSVEVSTTVLRVSASGCMCVSLSPGGLVENDVEAGCLAPPAVLLL